MRNRVLWGAMLAGACVTAVACGGGNKNADTARADTTAAATTATPAPAPAPSMNDSNIVAMLDAANAGDSAGGKLASTKGTNAQVKEFGRTMMRDHHALRQAGQQIAKKDSIGAAMPSGDTLLAHVKKVQDSLTAQAKGPAWDKAYIDAEVDVHQAVLGFLQQAQGAAQHADLKDAIGKAIPNIQNHLTMAQNIQSKLGTTASTGAGGGESTKAGGKAAKK
jgi:putative membrane protein